MTQLDSTFGDSRTWLNSRLGDSRTWLDSKLSDSTRWLKLCDSSHCDRIDIFKMTRKKKIPHGIFTPLLSQLEWSYTFICWALHVQWCMTVVKIHTIDRQKDLHQTFHPTLHNFRFLRYCKFSTYKCRCIIRSSQINILLCKVQ